MICYIFIGIWTLYAFWNIYHNHIHYSITDWIIILIVWIIPCYISMILIKTNKVGAIKKYNRKISLQKRNSKQKSQLSNASNFIATPTLENPTCNSDNCLKQVPLNDSAIPNFQKGIAEKTISVFNYTNEDDTPLFNFSLEFEQTLSLAEEKLFALVNDISKGRTLDDRILKVRKVISHYEHFKNFCYSNGNGGKEYFQSMWEHCFNSTNPDFDYIDQYKELLDHLINIKFSQDEMAAVRNTLLNIIKEQPGILQKDIYGYFTPDLRLSIRGELMQLASFSMITRIKHGNTYELYIQK